MLPTAPRLRPHARLHWCAPRKRSALLLPERTVWLNSSAAEIVALLDGKRTVDDLAAELTARHPGAFTRAHLEGALAWCAARGLLADVPASAVSAVSVEPVARPNPTKPEPPAVLLCELTYRCPLRCGYCSNPIELERYRDELDMETWLRVLDEAASLGVVQCHFSGGEPLLRADLEALIERARALGMYTNLITSGRGLTDERLVRLRDAGLEHFQLSFQHVDEARADAIAGLRAHADKLALAGKVRALGMALSVNVVLHEGTIDAVGALIALAEGFGAQRIELASTQYHGWALRNREALLPTREQVDAARLVAEREKARLHGRMDVVYVLPDYYTDLPKPCMDGWGRRFVTVTPDGQALPCPGAHSLPLPSASVKEHSLGWLWYESERFRAYRGDDWMQEPCSSCERKALDYGGCRCQAHALTGEARSADPACHLAPAHGLVRAAREVKSERPAVLYRVRTRAERADG